MGVADYIKRKFLGQELCISVNNDETETVIYDVFWSLNREYLQGIVAEVEDDVVALEIDGWGTMHISADNIALFWEPGKTLHKAFRATFTGTLGPKPRTE